MTAGDGSGLVCGPSSSVLVDDYDWGFEGVRGAFGFGAAFVRAKGMGRSP